MKHIKDINNPDDSIQEGLRLMRQCPLCKKDYKEDEIEVIETRDKIHLVHITCDDCKNAVLALIIISNMGMSSVGIVTDLTAHDVVKMRGKEPISEDNLLDFHELLKEHQSTFIQSLIR